MRPTRSLSLLMTLSLAATLVGCGVAPGVTVQSAQEVGFDAAASKTLKQGFKDIHTAIFTRIDTNGDNFIDEYEAGPYFSLTKEFPKADKGRGKSKRGNGKISRSEFMRYATAGGFLSGSDNPNKFMERMRNFLAQAFSRLDKPAKNSGMFAKGDGYLSNAELSNKALRSLGLGFAYDKLHVRVVVKAISNDEFAAADKTGDGKLSLGEFEDLYIQAVVKAINPNVGGAPPSDPGTPPADPGTPPADPGTPPAEPMNHGWFF